MSDKHIYDEWGVHKGRISDDGPSGGGCLMAIIALVVLVAVCGQCATDFTNWVNDVVTRFENMLSAWRSYEAPYREVAAFYNFFILVVFPGLIDLVVKVVSLTVQTFIAITEIQPTVYVNLNMVVGWVLAIGAAMMPFAGLLWVVERIEDLFKNNKSLEKKCDLWLRFSVKYLGLLIAAFPLPFIFITLWHGGALLVQWLFAR